MNTSNMERRIMNLIMKYGEKHELALECGAEYISQNDKARVDALILVEDIFDIVSEIYEC